MKLVYYISIFLVLFFSCTKESLPVIEPSSVSEEIYLNGNIAEENINLKAAGNYYMYSSFIFDSIEEVYFFIGELKERYCTSCGPSVTIRIKNNIKSPGGRINFSFDTIFKNGEIGWFGVVSEEKGLAEIILDRNNGNPPLSSMNSFSNTSQSLKIKSVELYHINELNQPTVRVKFEGKAYFNSVIDKNLFEFEGAFAFAFPQ